MFLTSDFSFTAWLQTRGESLTSNLTDLALDMLYEDLNIAEYLLDKCPDNNVAFNESKYSKHSSKLK